MKRIWDNINKWIRTDGWLHILVSCTIVFALEWHRPVWVVPVIAIAIGIGKEIYDKVSGKGTPEWHDLICDVIGIAIGMAFLGLNLLIR